jgi:hypothetical protein
MNLKRLATQGHGLGRTGQETNATPLAKQADEHSRIGRLAAGGE